MAKSKVMNSARRGLPDAPRLFTIAGTDEVCAADGTSAEQGVRVVPGETDLHKTLKKEACRWLYRMGYRCIAAEVRLSPLGIIDAVGTGLFRPYHNYLFQPRELPQVCFIECKASRADFLRDHSNDGQLHLCLMERDRNRRRKRNRPLRQSVGL